MTRFALPFASALVLVACGRRAAISSVAPSQLAPAEAFACVMKTFQKLGFQRTMYDQDELRTSARKENRKITFSNLQFRKTWDRIDVDVVAGESGTDLKVLTVTEVEYFNQTGKVLEQIPASADVQRARRDLLAHCEGSIPVSSDSVAPASQ